MASVISEVDLLRPLGTRVFIDKEGKAVFSINELQEEKKWEDFVEEHISLWKKTMHVLGYFPVSIKHANLPVWSINPFPDGYKGNRGQWCNNNLLGRDESIAFFGGEWAPNFIPDQAYALERKLVKWGEYQSKVINFKQDFKEIRYFGSEVYQDISNSGKSELDIICRSFLEFADNKEKLLRKSN